KMRHSESRLPRARHRRYDFPPMGRRQMQCDGSITDTVLVTAFEAVPRVAEHERAWRQHRGPVFGAVLERSGAHRRDTNGPMLLFNRPIARTGGADDVGHLPARARGEDVRGKLHSRNYSNFSQAAKRSKAYQKACPPYPKGLGYDRFCISLLR